MSLSDALLLEPPLPAIQTPVVIRPDFLTTFGDPSEAVAIAPNPFKEGDTIIVSGVTGAGAEVWNGVFAIYSVFPSVFRYRMNQVPAAPPGDYDYITAVRILYQEVYIALRTDGQLGSGTQADPWNGSAVSASVNPPFEIKQLKFVTLSNPERYLATAVTNDNHPFVAGDYITVAGVDSGAGLGDPKLSDSYYMGTYRLESADGNSFTYYTVAKPYRSPAVAEGPGEITCWREREQFDRSMRALGPGTSVHIGPGVFTTKGFNGFAGGWRVQSKSRIIGSGMGATTLKLVGASLREQQYVALGTVYSGIVEDFTAQDFAVDCNVAGQLNQFVACAAVSLPGRHIRIRRIRAINFASQTLSYVENFVFTLSTIHPDSGQTWDGNDLVFEDCIAEQPGFNPLNNSSIFLFGGGEIPFNDGRMYYHRGCVMRNNYVNTELWFGPTVQIDQIIYADSGPDAGLATLTGKEPHGLTKPGNVLVRGAALSSDGSLANPYNGVFAIHSIESNTVLKYRPAADIISGLWTATGGTIGGGISGLPVEIDKIELFSGRKYKITTLEPHFRTTNNNVVVSGILLKPALTDLSKLFNGAFAVDPSSDPSKPTELIYEIPGDPVSPDVLSNLDFRAALVNVGHIAMSPEHGTAAIAEGNRILHCHTGGPYHDTWSTRDLIIRNNYYHDIINGPKQNLTGVSFWIDGFPLALIRDSTDPQKAIATTSQPHGFSTNDFVIIFGTPDASNYNGTHKITGVTAKTFNYSITDGTLSESALGGKYRVTENLRPLASLTKQFDGTKWVITAIMAQLPLDTSQRHGLEKGDAFRLINAGYWNAIGTSPFNNPVEVQNRKVDAVPSDTQFQFYMSADPGADSSSDPNEFSAGYFGRIWQFGRLTIENNVIELAARKLRGPPIDGSYWRGIGIHIYVGGHPPQFTGRQLAILDNIIRFVDNALDPNPGVWSNAMEVLTTENTLLQGNIVRLSTPFPMLYYYTSGVRTFFNMTHEGNLIEAAYPDLSYLKAPEVITKVQGDVEDLTVMAILK